MIYTIIDIETNGLGKQGVRPDILEVGYIQINKKCEILRGDSFYFYKPEWVLDQQAAKVHKLTESYLEQYSGEYYSSLVKLYTLLDGGHIIGKNSHVFDIPVMQDFFRREDYGIFPVINSSFDIQILYKPIFQEWYQETYKQSTRKSGTLGELVDMCGFDEEQIIKEFVELFPDCPRKEKHGALYDTYLTYLVTKYATKHYELKL